MPPSPPTAAIDSAFPDRPDLRKRTHAAISQSPSLAGLFGDIAGYIHELRASGSKLTNGDSDEQAAKKKKRKLEHDAAPPNQSNATTTLRSYGAGAIRGGWEKGTYYSMKELSFSVPQRKKFTLEVGRLEGQGVRARNAATGEVEFGVLWREIRHALCLPVPEKALPQYNFVIFPVNSDGVNSAPSNLEASAAEPLVWTIPEGPPKSGVLGDGNGDVDADETYRMLLLRWIGEGLGRKVVQPDEKEFVSQMVQAHRKGEKAVHVKGFRGSKDGYLFFLPTGILWAFKKPLLFFSFDSIDSVSYTSVLQRTFDLNISTRSAETDTAQEFEFSMLDQADFASIDAYIRQHNLQDASMAEQRRAKKLNINGPKQTNGEAAADGNSGEEEVGELEKAAREVQEMEDDEDGEDDENFDPGSEGESEGSGSSSEEEDGGGEEGGNGDLVGEELGSEAEDVDVDEE
ncbi:hypothetical protein MMC08_004074 [Hypocenomyce scalaris]|nr:hypothetical protein [Hypocenomyce scalaris]